MVDSMLIRGEWEGVGDGGMGGEWEARRGGLGVEGGEWESGR